MADPTVESIYEQPWSLLKEHGTVSLEVMPALWKRVKKGIIKRKDEDRAYKILMTLEPIENRARLSFSYDKTTRILTAKLSKRFDLGD